MPRNISANSTRRSTIRYGTFSRPNPPFEHLTFIRPSPTKSRQNKPPETAYPLARAGHTWSALAPFEKGGTQDECEKRENASRGARDLEQSRLRGRNPQQRCDPHQHRPRSPPDANHPGKVQRVD